jgi:hypothetical protein
MDAAINLDQAITQLAWRTRDQEQKRKHLLGMSIMTTLFSSHVAKPVIDAGPAGQGKSNVTLVAPAVVVAASPACRVAVTASHFTGFMMMMLYRHQLFGGKLGV